MHPFSRFVLFLAAGTLLAACGNRGPLTLPPKPQTATAPAVDKTASDHSSSAHRQ